jgi:hypothetical protein
MPIRTGTDRASSKPQTISDPAHTASARKQLMSTVLRLIRSAMTPAGSAFPEEGAGGVGVVCRQGNAPRCGEKGRST